MNDHETATCPVCKALQWDNIRCPYCLMQMAISDESRLQLMRDLWRRAQCVPVAADQPKAEPYGTKCEGAIAVTHSPDGWTIRDAQTNVVWFHSTPSDIAFVLASSRRVIAQLLARRASIDAKRGNRQSDPDEYDGDGFSIRPGNTPASWRISFAKMLGVPDVLYLDAMQMAQSHAKTLMRISELERKQQTPALASIKGDGYVVEERDNGAWFITWGTEMRTFKTAANLASAHAQLLVKIEAMNGGG